MSDFSQIWLNLLDALLQRGEAVAPRGKLTKELLQQTIQVDMRRPVLTILERKLSYRFMAAEAFWVLSGDDRVATIAPYNGRIANFSDDGVTFFGAYGPKIVAQLPYVVAKLRADPMSRQAGLTTWRESPPTTKDVPCTVAMFFSLRDGKLNNHVFMRSSDAWLGVPYDVFNFSMVAHFVCALINQSREHDPYEPGSLFLTMASSHLYQENFESALSCLKAVAPAAQRPTPKLLWKDPILGVELLRELRDSKPDAGYRWWEPAS
jgi:thymidylate synthase